jgi:hypothetical protein
LSEARPILPTDLLALASSGGHGYPNEAWTRERIGAEGATNPIPMLLDQVLAFTRGRSAWICASGQRLQGLAGARPRGGRQAWEVDYLIDVSQDGNVAVSLLECAIAEAGRAGAEKLFLRLDAESGLLPAVISAGFMAYREEVLYSGFGRARTPGRAAALRPVQPGDSYLLYRLYSLTTPESVRRSEAATYGEWQASQERRWLKNPVQLLHEQDSQVTARVSASLLPQGVSLDLVTTSPTLDDTSAMIDTAVAATEGEGQPLFVLVPEADVALAARLEEYGLTAGQRFVSLMRRTARPQTLPKLTPAIAKNAIGV